VFSAHGGEALRSVAFGRVDRGGHPIAGTEQEVRADTLCVGYGLTPNVELAIRMGCAMRHCEVECGWLPAHDENLRTSVERVYVAGEIAGIGGVDVAMAEGVLVGRAIAVELGVAAAPDLARLRHRCRVERRAARALLAAFPLLPGLYQMARPETILCRCEDVTLAEVQRAAATYGSDIRSVKLGTRAGMGPCQARICHQSIGGMLRQRCGSTELPTPCPSIQAPIKPVAVRTVAQRPAG
jgi:NAD(P)H-nitrite reductase large subunit